jgi:hypothetical protein
MPRPEDDGSEKLLFIIGSPRSGTSWLAKLFDSHPDVLYRHEPDIDLRDDSVPTLCRAADIPKSLEATRAYVQRLLDVRTLKTSGALPIFPKRYVGSLAPHFRFGYALGLRAMERLKPLAPLARRIQIPDFFDRHRQPGLHCVIKSVSSLGRAGLLAAALPQSRFVLILRHPCGQVGSMLRGRSLGLFDGRSSAAGLLGGRYGLTEKAFGALTPAEQCAWDWAVMNEFALDQMDGSPRLKVLRYEDLCTNPMEEARALIAFAGLSWDPQTERFIHESTTYEGPDRFYQVFRNAREAMGRWRREMDPAMQRTVMDIALRTRPGRLFADMLPCQSAGEDERRDG